MPPVDTATVETAPAEARPDSPGIGAKIDLKAGLNVKQVQVTALRTGPQKFEAFFEPFSKDGNPVGDTILENNHGVSVTFVSGEGKVLVLAESGVHVGEDHSLLLELLVHLVVDDL